MASQDVTAVREILADLYYASYVANRDHSPEVSPERWAKLYGFSANTTASFERHYQAERTPHCEGYWSMGGTGVNDIPCLEPTVKCPVCGEESGLCAEHLFHCDACNKDCCTECMEAVGWPCKGCEREAGAA